MWSLDLDRISPLVAGGLGSLAIETGTCRGNGARLLARYFPEVKTIELSAELHGKARARFEKEGLTHVEALLGNSAELIPSLVRHLPAQETVFFYLDAHWSGDHTVDWSQNRWKGYGVDTAHLGKGIGRVPTGPEQVPMAEELAAIAAHCRARAVVLMDDMDKVPATGAGGTDMGFPGEDWSHLSRASLLAIVGARLEKSVELKNPDQWLLILRGENASPRTG